MSIWELILLALALYYVAYVLMWFLLDCNVALWYNSHFGTPISALRGQVIWITGASSGIGRAFALTLARQGVRLALSARRIEMLEELKKECIQEARGMLADKDVLVLPMDVLQLNKHEEYFDRVLQEFGRIDVLVCNAGRSQRAAFEDINIQVDRDVFELNLFSVIHLTRIAARHFVEVAGGRGHIAVTSSIAGMGVVPFSSSYNASKSALNAYMQTLNFERPELDVTIFAPGPIATDFLLEAFTAKPGEKCGQSTKNQKRMTAERCAHLFAVSIANREKLSWCGLFPINALGYLTRYPWLMQKSGKLMTKGVISKLREGKL